MPEMKNLELFWVESNPKSFFAHCNLPYTFKEHYWYQQLCLCNKIRFQGKEFIFVDEVNIKCAGLADINFVFTSEYKRRDNVLKKCVLILNLELHLIVKSSIDVRLLLIFTNLKTFFTINISSWKDWMTIDI